MMRAVFQRLKRGLQVLCLLLPVYGTSAVGGEPPAAERRIAVLYPQLQPPYDQIFKSIIDGIDGAHQGPLLRFELASGIGGGELAQMYQNEKPDAVIALGTRSVDLLLQGDLKIRHAIAGAVLMQQDDDKRLSGISIAPDPGLIFAHLKRLVPSIKKIKVIHQQGDDHQVLEVAAQAAKELGVELTVVSTGSIQEVAGAYSQQLRKQDSSTEALWIPHTGSSLEPAIMGKVLKEAWNRKLVVFSSNLADVRKGALFSLYPDNRALGQRLVALLYEQIGNPAPKRAVRLSDNLLFAINTRTANHLGVHLNANELATYQLVYPEGK